MAQVRGAFPLIISILLLVNQGCAKVYIQLQTEMGSELAV